MAEGQRQIFPYIFLGLSVAAVYFGYQNSRLPPGFEPVARDVACTVDSGCIVSRERPTEMRSDPIRRRYEWETTVGPVVVTCKKQFLAVGAWKCTSVKGTMAGRVDY